ncbi:MAG: penicillin-binding protein 2 [Alphaproteobacteria bacterium]|nr:penicillin-binding protein 2 [Alphaproteobacteria bacterium]
MAVTDYDRLRKFSRRAVLLGGLQLGVFALVAGRLYQLQVLGAEHYRTLAEDNRISLRLTAPPRGQIFDRTGTALAVNQQNFRAIIAPERGADVKAILDGVEKIVPLGDVQRKRIVREIREKRSVNGVLVADNLSWDQVAALGLAAPDLGGIDVQAGEVRTYPYGAVTAHILGYVGPVSEAELAAEPLLSLPGLRIGKSGMEREYDDMLRGKPGAEQMEVNAHGHVVRTLQSDAAVQGEDLQLTIDIGLQQYAQNRLLAERSGAAVVMDVKSGAVYALASHPGFDPNLFTYGISHKDWDGLNNDENAPLTNKAISGQYAPGSTFKMITALAALEAGTVDAGTTVFCPGHYDLGKHRFHCWKRGGHGHVNLQSAISGSCDTYFYEAGRRTGIDRIAAMARRFGLGHKGGIDLPHERPGLVPDQGWKLARMNEKWQQGETLINAIGQGYMLATPLQLAVMAARIGGGLAVMPGMTRHAVIAAEPAPLAVNRNHLAMIRKAMDGVVNGPHGTARGARIAEEGMAMAGKTGTSQVRRISKAERATGVVRNEDRPWKERDHALFVAFAPVENPRYAVAVVVEHGGSGSGAAAPIARDILRETMQRNIASA